MLKKEYKDALLKPKLYLLGVAAGILNGLFGAGGGLVVVPMLSLLEPEAKKAHATSIAVIMPLCIFSIFLAFQSGLSPDWLLLAVLVPSGLIGAVLGGFLLPKLKGVWLTRIFGAIMIFSALRILLR